MTRAICRSPSGVRWMPFIVNGDLAVAYSSLLGAKRSTNTTFFSAATSAMALVYSASRALFSLPSGKFGLCRFSCAIGENRTSRGLLLPLYFCFSVSSMNLASSRRKLSKPPRPGKRLIVAEEGKHDIGLLFAQP